MRRGEWGWGGCGCGCVVSQISLSAKTGVVICNDPPFLSLCDAGIDHQSLFATWAEKEFGM